MIETRLLRQFAAVAEELNFSRAAERLHMAQPPLSQAIRRLEEEIGARLFERTHRRVALTPAGVAFLGTARRVLHELDEGTAQTRRVAQGIDGHLTLTFINIANHPALLAALREFRQGSPGVAFTMREATTNEQVEALEAGEADLGFMRTPGTSNPRLRFATLLREPVCLALPAEHPLADRPSIELASMAGEPFVASARPLGRGFHDQLVRLCQAAGFAPRIVQQTRQLHTLVALVAAGFGVALVPASMVTASRPDVVFRPLSDDVPDHLRHLQLLMAWNAERASPLRDRFVDHMRQRLKA